MTTAFSLQDLKVFHHLLCGLWQLEGVGLERNGIFQDDTITCCSKFQGHKQVRELELIPACFQDTVWDWPSPNFSILVAATAAHDFAFSGCWALSPKSKEADTERLWESQASLCHLLVPQGTGRLGVEMKSHREAGNSVTCSKCCQWPRSPTWGREHPCCPSRVKGS